MLRIKKSRKLVPLKAPFPWFGGKSRAAKLVWQALGSPHNYVEPFAGSLAVLLARPHVPTLETVNDVDGLLVNFWRAVKAEPKLLSQLTDWPVTELDLHARHKQLIERKSALTEALRSDPAFFDLALAAWWVWGIAAWIGQGWGERWSKQIPYLNSYGAGVHSERTPADWALKLASRLRRTRVVCGDWKRLLRPAVMTPDRRRKDALTGVLLDPPYVSGSIQYGKGDALAEEVASWAFANGDNPRLRVVLCGYAGDYARKKGWKTVGWKANGGYGSQADGQARANSAAETLYLSPGCLPVVGEVPC